MPSRSQLPAELKREHFVKILVKLGFVIDKKGGNGSHYKAVWPSTQKSITIPQRLGQDVLYYLIKQIEKISTVRWKDIRDLL